MNSAVNEFELNVYFVEFNNRNCKLAPKPMLSQKQIHLMSKQEHFKDFVPLLSLPDIDFEENFTLTLSK